MPLAPARSRGAFLKARLAVNGIQCAARSLGTLTAAGWGLLSNMGGLFKSWDVLFLVRGAAQAISFAWSRKPATAVAFFSPIGGLTEPEASANRPYRSRI